MAVEDRFACLGQNLAAAVERLTGEAQMGWLFKMMALTRPGVAPPPFVSGI